MSPFDDTTIAHIRKSVVSHGFCDPTDWSIGLDELSHMNDEEIDILTSGWLQPGVSREQAMKDRELFDRVSNEMESGK